jgi:hypothetical protein
MPRWPANFVDRCRQRMRHWKAVRPVDSAPDLGEWPSRIIGWLTICEGWNYFRGVPSWPLAGWKGRG